MLSLLVSQLVDNEIDGYLLNNSDTHSNEYIGPSDLRLQNLTGFTGSNALAFFSKDVFLLWTDSRYYIQARNELVKEFKLIEDLDEFFKQIAKVSKITGIDKRFFSIKQILSFEKKASGLNFKGIDDIVDKVYKPKKKIFNEVYDLEQYKISEFFGSKLDKEDFDWLDIDSIYTENNVTGSKRIDKIQKIKKSLCDNEALIVSALDEISWLFNLRGNDIPYNSVFYSYAIITKKRVILFSGHYKSVEKIAKNEDGNNNLIEQTFLVKDYIEFENFLKCIRNKKVKIGKNVNAYIHDKLVEYKNEIEYCNLISDLKSIKNRTELFGFVLSHIYDSIALCKLFDWIYQQLINSNKISEEEVSNQLIKFKKNTKGFISPSFETISAFAGNGAIIHHKGGKDIIKRDNIFLIDSGSQYLFGTTDVTRTVCFGEPSLEQKINFTTVLKGQINAMLAIIPKKSPGSVLDIITREPIWKLEYNYPHGTGHGVGHFLNVHESPPTIGSTETQLQTDMVFSIEPGYYKENEYGIRIEDLVVTREK
ncbi:hypothetical protein COBT_003284, partial [Conglomerata obtusa]